jgi:hypothetical protein
VRQTEIGALVRKADDALCALSEHCQVQKAVRLAVVQNLAENGGDVELDRVISGETVLELEGCRLSEGKAGKKDEYNEAVAPRHCKVCSARCWERGQRQIK